MWLYGSGFPKSMDILKQIDKKANNNSEVIKAKEELGKWLKEKRGNRPQKEIAKYFPSKTGGLTGCVANWELGKNLPTWGIWVKLKDILDLDDRYDYLIEGRPSNYIEAEREVIGKGKAGLTKGTIANFAGTTEFDITKPSTDLAKQWNGWGTALKPSFEPIIVARKPFKGSLVDNVIEYGVGGINIDECRVGNETGRFPANTILTYDETDYDEVCGEFPYTKVGSGIKNPKGGAKSTFRSSTQNEGYYSQGSEGSASRYFYCAKASKKDRDEGLDEFEQQKVNDGRKKDANNAFQRGATLRHNIHPTVKPTSLMQYLVRLVTPKGGIVLDPFMGSGSTGKAVMFENKERDANYSFIGIEREEEYCNIAKARIEWASEYKESKEDENQISFYDLL